MDFLTQNATANTNTKTNSVASFLRPSSLCANTFHLLTLYFPLRPPHIFTKSCCSADTAKWVCVRCDGGTPNRIVGRGRLGGSWSEIRHSRCVSNVGTSQSVKVRPPYDDRLTHLRQNRLRDGEIVLDVMDYVEDTKGNPRDAGRLFVTNLRIVWYSLTNRKFNLCKWIHK